MRRGAFVSQDWVGPVLASVVSASALVGRPGAAATLVVLAIVTCFGWSAVARALLAGRRLSDSRRIKLLRRVCIGQCLGVAVIWAVSMTSGHLLAAVTVLVAGTALSVLVWPWRWRLAQAADDRGRSHDRALFQQHLTAAGILLVLAAGSAVALSALACILLLALTTSSLVDAWDEWRRPRALRAGETGTGGVRGRGVRARGVRGRGVRARGARARGARARGSIPPAGAVAVSPVGGWDTLEDEGTLEVATQHGTDQTPPAAHASHRRRRGAAQRYTGRRVATRRS